MPKFILAGGSPGKVKLNSTPSGVHGFPWLASAFDHGIWEGWYIHCHKIFENPNLLDGADICMLVTDCLMPDNPAAVAAINHAHEVRCLIGGEPNGGHGGNLLKTGKGYKEFLSNLDYIQIATENESAKSAFTRQTGRPTFGLLPPIHKEAMNEALQQAAHAHIELPSDIDQYFVMGHHLVPGTMTTLETAIAYDIPLMVTLYDEPCQHAMDIAIAEGCRIKYMRVPSNPEWLYLLSRSRGIYNFCPYPSGGRPSLYAALCGKPSIATPHGWQEALFPESTMRGDFMDAQNWEIYEAKSKEVLPDMPNRIENYRPKPVQDRITAWIEKMRG